MSNLCTTIHVLDPSENKKRGLDLLKMEIWIVVSHQVVLGIEPRSSGRLTSVFNC